MQRQLLFAATLLLSLSARAAPPAADETPAKVVEEPAPTTQTLADGRIEFTPPEGWIAADKSSTATRAVFISDTREGVISVETPPDMILNAETGPFVVRDLRSRRKKAGVTVMAAEIETDKNVNIRIHERYTRGDRIADQLHLYKRVGKRVVMV